MRANKIAEDAIITKDDHALKNSERNDLIAAILEGDSVRSASLARGFFICGVKPEHIVLQCVEPAMARLDAKCTLEQFNLLEIMLAGRAVTEVMKVLYPTDVAMDGGRKYKGTVVIATLEGDVHDLGKNIFKMIIAYSGYRVVDCGKDCPLQKLVEVAEKERPIAVGVSGMITSIIPLVKQVKDQLALRGLDRVKVIAGGAALKQSEAGRLNIDFVAESAFDGLHYLEGLREAGHE